MDVGRCIFGVFSKYFALIIVMPRAMQQSCFITGRPIAYMDCIIFLALVIASLLRVGWWGVFYPLTCPSMSITIILFTVVFL